MDMSKAAMPARFGNASKDEMKHPIFPKYQEYRASMRQLMVDSSDFKDWLSCHEAQAKRDKMAQHEQYPAFLQWMDDNQGGARKCPAGVFPANFQYWLNGGRW